MAMLQVRDMDDRLYDRLKFVAKLNNRSISQQVVTILQDYFTSVHSKTKNATEEFLRLAGTWEDSRPTEEIIDDMDLLIAATAIYNELTLVTNNTKNFENIPNLSLENWKK